LDNYQEHTKYISLQYVKSNRGTWKEGG